MDNTKPQKRINIYDLPENERLNAKTLRKKKRNRDKRKKMRKNKR